MWRRRRHNRRDRGFEIVRHLNDDLFILERRPGPGGLHLDTSGCDGRGGRDIGGIDHGREFGLIEIEGIGEGREYVHSGRVFATLPAPHGRRRLSDNSSQLGEREPFGVPGAAYQYSEGVWVIHFRQDIGIRSDGPYEAGLRSTQGRKEPHAGRDQHTCRPVQEQHN